MADTRQQSMIEMNRQLEELRLQQTKQAEEQSARNQELKEELKDLLREYFSTQGGGTPKQSPIDPSSSSTQESTHVQPIRTEPPDLTGGQLSNLRQQPSVFRAPINPSGLSTQLAKIDFPKFDGSLLHEWIHRCEQLFLLDGTSPEMKVRLVSIHMEGKALQWHHNYMNIRFGMFPSWPEYIVDVSTRFGRLFADPLADMVNFKQTTESIEDYLDKFECAHQVFDEMPESQNCIKHNLCVDSLKDNDKGLCEVVNRIERDEEPSQFLVENEPNSANESSVLIAHQVLDKMPQPTKTIEVNLTGVLTKDDEDDDDLLEMASWIEEDFELATRLKPVRARAVRLIRLGMASVTAPFLIFIFDPGAESMEQEYKSDIFGERGILLSAVHGIVEDGNFIEDLIVVEGNFIEDSKGKISMPSYLSDLNVAPSSSDAEAGNVLPSGTTYPPNPMKMKMLQLSNTSSGDNNHFTGWKIQGEDEQDFPAGDLTEHDFTDSFMGGFSYMQDPSVVLDQGIAAEISVPSDLASFNEKNNSEAEIVKFPSKLPAQKVRMVDYIVVVCFNVWVFDPGGSWFLHIELKVTIARLTFDPGGQCSRFTETGGFCFMSTMVVQSKIQAHHQEFITRTIFLLFDPWGQGS